MIKNLLFDMGGVVFLQDTEEACRRFRAVGIDTDKYMGMFGQKEFFLEVENGEIDTATFCRKMAKATRHNSISYEEAEYCWLGFVSDVPEDRLQNLLKLKERYTVGLLSNTNPFIMGFTNSPRFSRLGLPISHYFHTLYLSYELKVCKPSLNIFRKVLELGGMKAEETVFVDDSLRNIEAAEALGFHGLHVETNADWRQPLMDWLERLNTTTPEQSKP